MNRRITKSITPPASRTTANKRDTRQAKFIGDDGRGGKREECEQNPQHGRNIRILRQAAMRGNGEAMCREHNISEQRFYRWKKKCGGSFRLGRSNGRKRLF